MRTDKKISRRAWLAKSMFLLAAARIAPQSASATEGKATKSAVHYQDSPKGRQMCGMCKYFAGGMMGEGMMREGMMGGGMMGGHGMMSGQCQLVEGSISMMGGCDLYSPRGA